jgi:hypothetical protein
MFRLIRTKNMRLKTHSWMWILILTVWTFIGSQSALAHGDHQTDFSGWEIFLGVTHGNVTRGVIFVCWTHELSENWLSPAQTDGGLCSARIDYQGSTGIGGSVEVLGGRWSWQAADGTTHSGRVLNGEVVWPSALNVSIGCGNGVARFAAGISLGPKPVAAGEIEGCLDDAHGLIPPRIWGSITLN